MKTIFKFLLPVLLLASCAKDKYQPKGDYQPSGNYGNASISSSADLAVFPADYTTVWSNGVDYDFSAQISCNLISQKVLDNGIVMAYMKDTTNGNNMFYALPFSNSQNSTSAEFSLHANFFYTLNTFYFRLHGFDKLGPTTPADFGTVILRIVVFSNARQIPENLSLTNYQQVKDYLHLPD